MIALDTNILVYVESPADRSGRRAQAIEILDALAPVGAIIPLQVLGEFLNVCRVKKILGLEFAMSKTVLYATAFNATATSLDDLQAAAQLSDTHRLQFFDALVMTVARRAGATTLLSEDMHDGLVIDNLTIINPFAAANAALLADLLAPAP